MKRTVIQLLAGLSTACLCLTGSIATAQAQRVNTRYLGRTGDFVTLPVSFNRSGQFRFSATSRTGDVDMFVYDSAGRQIGSGRNVGNELLGGRLSAGRYVIYLRMAKCAQRSACDANLFATFNGSPITFTRNSGRLTNPSSVSSLETCIRYQMSRNGYGRASSEELCKNLQRLNLIR